jgi:hypothetical protein
MLATPSIYDVYWLLAPAAASTALAFRSANLLFLQSLSFAHFLGVYLRNQLYIKR